MFKYFANLTFNLQSGKNHLVVLEKELHLQTLKKPIYEYANQLINKINNRVGNSYYNYVEEHKLLIECFCGETEIEDVFELKNKIEVNLSQVPKFSILVDIQENTDKPYHKMNDAFIEFYSKSELTLKIDSIAIVTNTPNQVVNTILFIDDLKEVFDIPIRVFSSLKPAINWLHSDVSIDKIKSMLEDFKNTIVLK
ncbi:hypothetical protein [Labilibaculum euxinus]